MIQHHCKKKWFERYCLIGILGFVLTELFVVNLRREFTLVFREDSSQSEHKYQGHKVENWKKKTNFALVFIETSPRAAYVTKLTD
jgi:hypothetical protein